MKSKNLKVIGGVFFLVLLALLFISIRVNAENESIDELRSRLIQYKVPLIEVNLISRFPFQVEIIIQTENKDNRATLDDLWNAQLVRREASMAYSWGLKIDNYKIVFIDNAGKTINWEQNFLSPDQASQKINNPVDEPRMDNTAAKSALFAAMKLENMKVDLFDVRTDEINKNRQLLLIQIDLVSLSKANQILPEFIPGLRLAIDKINAQGSRIVLCRMRVVDHNATVLLNYVWDSETREETSTSVNGLAAWYPHPKQQSASSTPIAKTIESYPAPAGKETQLQTPQPYPAP